MKCNAKAGAKRTAQRKKIKTVKNKEFSKALDTFYKIVWDNTPLKVCYETNDTLYAFNKWHVHHVLEKKYYPEHVLNQDVCVLLSLEAHALWHGLAPSDRQKKMPKTWAKYIELIKNYTNEN